MALFKISKGLNANLPTTLTEGYCWYTYDDSKFYIDYKDENGVLTRKALNAEDAETLTGASLATILNSSDVEIPTSKAVLSALNNKVDKVSGKGLSTNDYTTAEKNKLAGIATGANAYTHPSTHAASMITGLATVATSGSYNDLSDKPTIPTAYTLPAAGSSLGGVKSGGDVTISSGVITVNDDSHNHTIANVDGLQAVLDGKQPSGNYLTSETSLSKGTDATASKTLSFGDTFTAITDTAVSGHKITDTTTTYTMPSDRLFTTLVPTGTAIPDNADLNTTTYLKVGRYYCSANKTAATLTNCPSSDAFMMEVYSPLSTTIDNETTKTWIYRLRRLSTYTGTDYIQYCYAGSTAGTWTYGPWNKVYTEKHFATNAALTSGTKVGSITIDGETTTFYAPSYSAGTGLTLSGTTFSNSAALYYVSTLTVKQTGSSTSGAYLASKWSVANVNGITAPTDGMSIAIRTPADGFSGGILLSIDNGTTYYPLVRNVSTLVTTTYAKGSTVILTFNATQKASPYTSAGATTEITGCWQTADYDANTKTTTNSTNKVDAKLFLVGATKQGSSQTTYSNVNCYVGTDNCLYSNGSKVSTTDYTHPSYTAITGKPIAGYITSFGSTFTVSQITSDATGHVTGATDREITMPDTLSNGPSTAGLIKTHSTVTSSSGYTACPVINGVPYYKDTNTTYTLPTAAASTKGGLYAKLDGTTLYLSTSAIS